MSDNEVGIGGTNTWYMGGIDKNKSIAFCFDIAGNSVSQPHHKVYIQF